MAAPTITPEDFIGWFKISQNQFSKLQAYIDMFYEDFVIEAIGSDAFYEVDGQTTLQDKWQFLFDGGKYIDTEGMARKLVGLKDIANGVVYFQYVRDQFQPTIVGNVKSEQENSSLLMAERNNMIAVTRYNKSVRDINNSLFCYLDNFKEVKEGITSITNTVGTTYLIELPSTRYLYDGDTVEIGGAEYVVANLIDNTSFEVDSSSAVSGDTAIWYPYEKVELTAPMKFAII